MEAKDMEWLLYFGIIIVLWAESIELKLLGGLMAAIYVVGQVVSAIKEEGTED